MLEKLGLINGEVFTCTGVQSNGSILTREGKRLPASFRDFAHGYVVTSHKSQGRTHDQVVIAAAQMVAKAAYVACSRGRHQVSIFTPNKAQLFERAEQSGDRLSASDVLDPISLRPAVWQQQEQRAWQQALEQASVLQRISQRPVPATELEPPVIHLPLKEPEIHPQAKKPDIGLPFKEPEIRLPSKQLDWPSLGLGR